MRKHDWTRIEAKEGFDNPAPGAYIAVITDVEDNEDKEYLKVGWDFSEGAYKGDNLSTFQRVGFWPIALYRSYKESALGFFKAFKTALEESNPGYQFDEDDLQAMVGKRIGVVLGEEEYRKKNGDLGKRLYVAQTRSLDAIQRGDFKIPPLKRLAASPDAPMPAARRQNDPFAQLDDDDGDLPF